MRLLRIASIDVVAHPTWIISVAMLSALSWTMVADVVAPTASGASKALISLGAALVVSACIVVHELSHCAVARAYGLTVRDVMLFALGGVSRIEGEPPTARAEAELALAGPLASLMLASTFAVVSQAMDPHVHGFVGVWGAFAAINLALAVFNLLPSFPMDGGRLLRSVLWTKVGHSRATALASGAGRSFGALIAAGGGLAMVPAVARSSIGTGLYMVALGVFLFRAASRSGDSRERDR